MTWLRSHHSRFMGVMRENESRFLTSSPQRLLSLAIRSSDPVISSVRGAEEKLFWIQRFTTRE